MCVQLEHDNKVLHAECQVHRETMAGQVETLEAKLCEAQEQRNIQVEDLSLKLAELERCNSGKLGNHSV